MAKKADSSIGSTIKKLMTLRKSTTSAIHGGSDEFYEQNTKDLDTINDLVKGSSERIKNISGGDISGLFSSIQLNDKSKNKKDTTDESKKDFIDIEKVVNNAEEMGINELLLSEQTRLENYFDYRQIVKMIPQMSQAIDTYVDNITSPDDFSKNSLNVTLSDNASTDESKRLKILSNIDNLMKKYKIEERSPKIIKGSLIDGDHFISVIPIKKDFETFLNEEYNKDEEALYESYNLSEGVFTGLLNEAKEVLTADLPNLTVESWEGIKTDLSSLLSESLSSNVLVSKSSSTLTVTSSAYKDIFDKEEAKKEANKKKEKVEIDINGSVIKTLDPERVIKLEESNICFGYIYFEQISDDQTDLTSLVSSVDKRKKVNSLITTDSTENNAIKQKFINRLFVKGIAKKLNKDILESNPQFSDLIHNLLKQDYITKKKIRITYLSPSEVIHFGKDDGEGVYNESLFENVFFTAKLYVAILTSNLMHRLVRAPSKRLFYVEVGLDEDESTAINSFIRDVKSKDIKLDDMNGSISNVLSHIGTYNDVFVPVVDGSKPVEIETLEESSPDMQDEFLEWLMKGLLSGVGIPSSFVGELENVQFAKSLAQENSRFLRGVIRYQKKYGEQFSELVSKLYNNEYPDEDGIDEELVASFPSPASLNTTNLSEQISNAGGVIDYITEISVGRDDDKVVNAFKKEISKDFLPSVPWNRIDEVLQVLKKDAMKEKIKTGGDDTGGDAGGGNNW